jgi:hypothetical protein
MDCAVVKALHCDGRPPARVFQDVGQKPHAANKAALNMYMQLMQLQQHHAYEPLTVFLT